MTSDRYLNGYLRVEFGGPRAVKRFIWEAQRRLSNAWFALKEYPIDWDARS